MRLQAGMTKTDAAVQTLAEINPDVILEVGITVSVKVSIFYLVIEMEPCPTTVPLRKVSYKG